MIINDKKVCGIFHDEFEQNKEFEKLYMQNFYFDGNFVTSWRVKETGEGDFLHPHGIAVDSHGFVYVTEEKKMMFKSLIVTEILF